MHTKKDRQRKMTWKIKSAQNHHFLDHSFSFSRNQNERTKRKNINQIQIYRYNSSVQGQRFTNKIMDIKTLNTQHTTKNGIDLLALVKCKSLPHLQI